MVPLLNINSKKHIQKCAGDDSVVFGSCVQLRSVHLEQQLAASREECAAISSGLLGALSAISRQTTQDPSAADEAVPSATQGGTIAEAGSAGEAASERVAVLELACTDLESQLAAEKLHSVTLEEALQEAEADKAALEQRLEVKIPGRAKLSLDFTSDMLHIYEILNESCCSKSLAEALEK